MTRCIVFRGLAVRADMGADVGVDRLWITSGIADDTVVFNRR